VFCCKDPAEQGVSLAIAVTEKVLAGRGGFRVHGGGFAGTMQAFVPYDLLDEYKQSIENVFGADSCKILSVRKDGGVRVI